MHPFQGKQLQNMFEKSRIRRATPHQHINLKQSLKIEIHKFCACSTPKIRGFRFSSFVFDLHADEEWL